ncbi:DENN domain-containing protein 4C isoform X2 [Cimex lectularius]|uniref:Uncharacterized protein n=1 Tax=Cimex lectularius TaxID=79782 RepID=A0A8I6S4C5_CIMLE|nr:DENN domain-containing protein 4C isoform X2 [Cimex lectularius]
MDERRVVDYFVIAGLPQEMRPLDDFSKEGNHMKSSHSQAPITDITVFFPSLNEDPPEGYTVLSRTPAGNLADLNHGSLRSPDVYLCFRRGFDRPPLVDIGVMFEGKESILSDSEVVATTHGNHCANINNSTAKTFLTFRRAKDTMPCNSLVVTEIAVILTSKGETAPHAFCMIKKNLNRGIVGSDVYICYKKSMNRTNLITYKPGILLRYPFEDRENLPLPETVPMFCLPLGCSLEKWPKAAQQPDPIFSTFVLTVSDAAEKLYGSAIMFYESYPEELLTDEQKKALDGKPGFPETEWTYNVNKCICLLSRWPFFDTFERFLIFLYEMSISTAGPHAVSIERFILYFMEEIPFPSPQGPGILVELSPTDKLFLTQPEELPLPRSGAKFRQLLMNLGADNCLLILVCALTEQKILVHSLRPDVLTAVAEAVSMILFPFKWQCPYIPLCPLGLAEVLHAPLPFLIGVDSRFFDLYDPPPDVICIDLDTNNVSMIDEKKREREINIKLLPKKPGRVLRQTLETLYKQLAHFIHEPLPVDTTSIDKEFQFKRKEQKLELDIQVAFLQFMATILKGYKNFLLPITKAPTVGTTDTNSLFDLNGFLKSRDKWSHKFFNYVTKTQMFIRFIEERSFVSDMDAGLAFFDECTDKVEEDENVHLLEVDDSHQSERTVIIMPPEPTGQIYTYQGFNLNHNLLQLNHFNNLLSSSKDKKSSRHSGSGIAPGSPMARRTKHEIKAAQRLARKCSTNPQLWAQCLWSTCCSIWFIHLPSYVLSAQSPPAILQYAYDVMVKVHKCKLTLSDEICFRVMMQLCGVYRLPVVAVKLLFHMKRAGIQPNAITYGFYNRAVLEATWPSGMSNSSQLLWNKLRNVILCAALFKKGLAGKRKHSTAADDNLSLLDPSLNCGSHTSIDSAGSLSQKVNDNQVAANSEGFVAFDNFRSKVGSIVRPTGLPLLNQSTNFKQHTFESSAGLLITGAGGPLKEEELDLTQFNVVTSPNGLVSSNKRRYRSGSCTEFNNPLRQPPPTSPPISTINKNSYKILTRSESFANDAGILAKLHTLKLDSLPLSSSRDSLKEKPKMLQGHGKPWSKSLFGRRGSLNLRKFKDQVTSDSYESSTENLGSTGSGAGGSYEDIYNISTPKRNKLNNSFGMNNKYKPERHSSTSNIVSELNENQCSDSKSPIKSPSRTPVTENDPLGALLNEGSEQEEEEEEEKKTVSRVPSEIELDHTGAPLLFERRLLGDYNSVVRSATFTNEESDEEYETGVRNKSMHRSSTMPINNSMGENPNQQPSIGSFKLPFTRYSPSRFSLRKAADRINTQMIENAITSLSPSLTSKKSNELIMGGLSSLKSAATSVAKKIDEIKGAISANTTPVKSANHWGTLERDACLLEDESEYGEEYSASRRKISMDSPQNRGQLSGNNFTEWLTEGSRKGSSVNLGNESSVFEVIDKWANRQCLYPKFQRDPSIPVALQITMTTCSKCHNCSTVLYDEEIMAGWIPEDSNLNTKCQFCDKATVPLLSVSVVDYRNSPMPTLVKERKISSISLGTSQTSLVSDSGFVNDGVQPKTCDPITVPYLNPLVLRKEFESILAAEGDAALIQPKFVDEHPIIYWNMVWMFTRINMDSHFPGLALGSNATISDPHPSWENANSSNVLISTMWHNHRLNDEVGAPMYLSWNVNDDHSSLVSALVTDQTRVSAKDLQSILHWLQYCNIIKPLEFLAVERKKLKGRGHSLYREILFLGITAIGKENIDQVYFDKDYKAAYEKVIEKDPNLYLRSDQPLTLAAMWCRQYFRPLEL